MFISPKKVKGKYYYYLIHNAKKKSEVVRNIEICLGTKEKVDKLFEDYNRKRK